MSRVGDRVREFVVQVSRGLDEWHSVYFGDSEDGARREGKVERQYGRKVRIVERVEVVIWQSGD